MTTECPVCGVELPERSGPGRPPTYCGEVCRRAAEYQIRGIVRRIQKAEDEEQRLRFLLATESVRIVPEKAERERAWWAEEITRLRWSLRGVL